MIPHFTVCYRAWRMRWHLGASLYQRQRSLIKHRAHFAYLKQECARMEEEETFARYAPLTRKMRRCRILRHNPKRPWVEFLRGPTIQRRRAWIRDM